MNDSQMARAPPEIREAFEHDPVYCTECEMAVSVTVVDDGQPLRWECPCATGYPTGRLPDQWHMPDPEECDSDE